MVKPIVLVDQIVENNKCDLSDAEKIKAVANAKMKAWRQKNAESYKEKARARYKVKANDPEKGAEWRKARYESCKKSHLKAYEKLVQGNLIE